MGPRNDQANSKKKRDKERRKARDEKYETAMPSGPVDGDYDQNGD